MMLPLQLAAVPRRPRMLSDIDRAVFACEWAETAPDGRELGAPIGSRADQPTLEDLSAAIERGVIEQRGTRFAAVPRWRQHLFG